MRIVAGERERWVAGVVESTRHPVTITETLLAAFAHTDILVGLAVLPFVNRTADAD